MSPVGTALKQALSFTYLEYAQIIDAYKPAILDFKRAGAADGFCLIRHDIEFSLPRAIALAEIDAGLGIQSTFFVQVKNGAYNPLAPLNAKSIRKLFELSHFVGLHFYISDIAENDVGELIRQLKFQTLVLEEALGQKVSQFSYHRPPLWALKLDLKNETDLLNAYAPEFFELTNGTAEPLHIKYMADSQHAWKYGHPLTFRDKYKKFQILMHPDEWSQNGSDPLGNFRELIDLNRSEFLRTLQTECNHFKAHYPANEI
jgi:hypothetical protein